MGDEGLSDGQLRDLVIDFAYPAPGERQRVEPRLVAELLRRGGYFDVNGIRYVVKDGRVRLTLPT